MLANIQKKSIVNFLPSLFSRKNNDSELEPFKQYTKYAHLSAGLTYFYCSGNSMSAVSFVHYNKNGMAVIQFRNGLQLEVNPNTLL